MDRRAPGGDVQEVIQGALLRRGDTGGNPRVKRILHTGGDGDHEFVKGGTGGEDNLPGPEDMLSPYDQLTWQYVISRPLGQPTRQARPGLVIKELPAQVRPDTLELVRLGGQPLGDLPKQHQGQILTAGPDNS